MPTSIVLNVNGIKIPATLNDTIAAQDFKKHLPKKFTGYRSEFDFCCQAACGLFDPTETQSGWKNGDISLSGGWFAIFIDGEKESKNYRGIMVIAHLEKSALEQVKNLPESIRLTVEIDEDKEKKE